MPDTVLCGCGSGLRQIRCCNLDAAALPEPVSLEILNPMAAEAMRLYNAKNLREAETLVLKLLDLAPNHRQALRILFELRKADNRNSASEVLARRLAGLATDNPALATAANLALAQFLIGRGRHAEAEPATRIALKNSPRDVSAHHAAGVIFTETGLLRQGEHHYRQALALHALDDGMLLGNLAWNLKLQGRLDAATATYERALAIRPDNRRAIGGYAQAQAAGGNKQPAAALLDAALAKYPDDRTLRLLRCLLDLSMAQPEAVLARLHEDALLPAERIARGRALLQLGRTGDAVAAFGAARRQQRETYGQSYAPAAFTEKSERYKKFFIANRLACMPRTAPVELPQPVFLLGFPGSGTSLLEQLLAKIPGFAAADETAPIADLLQQPELAGYPECLSDFLIGDGEERLAALRARYLKNLAGEAAEPPRFVTLRAAGDAWHLGLINLLFPEAPILHLLRHPLDVAVTNFARDKKLEGNCAVSLATLAEHYALTMSMIRHYRGQLALRYLSIRYENLVDDPAVTLTRVLEFIGIGGILPDAGELRVNRLAAGGRVPGHAVTQKPIHRRGIGSFLIFEQAAPNLLTEIRPILSPWVEELGYAP